MKDAENNRDQKDKTGTDKKFFHGSKFKDI